MSSVACIMGLTFLEINRDMDSTPTGRLRSRYRVLGVGGRALNWCRRHVSDGRRAGGCGGWDGMGVAWRF